MSRDEIFRAALSLPDEARAELADRLLDSLNVRADGDEEEEDIDEAEIEALWAREAEDRLAAYYRGEITAIPGEEVFASLKFRDKV